MASLIGFGSTVTKTSIDVAARQSSKIPSPELTVLPPSSLVSGPNVYAVMVYLITASTSPTFVKCMGPLIIKSAPTLMRLASNPVAIPDISSASIRNASPTPRFMPAVSRLPVVVTTVSPLQTVSVTTEPLLSVSNASLIGFGSTVTRTVSDTAARQSSPLPPSSVSLGPKVYAVTVYRTTASTPPVCDRATIPLSGTFSPREPTVSIRPITLGPEMESA